MSSAKSTSGINSKAFPFYNQDGIRVRLSHPTDDFALKDEDCYEIWHSHRMFPEEAVGLSIEKSIEAYTVLIDEKPEIAFGINPISLVGNEAVIWMLSSDKIRDIGVRFARHSRSYIDNFLKRYSNLFNYCSVENKITLKWLFLCGARFENPINYGIGNKQFVRFSFR